ncbi:MAG: tetratricopeptide repeat protein [Candidatus Delongbacteria bacterium]|nr:tetratricopeptide repeat protein [Candidatus Delongbacteria bacterium]
MADKRDTLGHLSKDEMQEDAFVAGAIKAAAYVRHNRKSLITALIILVAVAFGTRMYLAYRAEVQGEANVLLNRGTNLFAAEEYDLALEFFNRVSEQYSGSDAAGYAVYYRAMTAWRQQDLATAETLWHEYLDNYRNDKMITAVATAGLAVCSESRGEYAEAAALFNEAAHSGNENFWASHNLFQAALCLEQTQDYAAALSNYELIQELYPESPEARDIEMYLERVKYKLDMNR